MAVKEQVQPRSETSSNYVDFDEFIDFQLKKTRAGIHQADLLSGLILFSVGLTGYLLLFAICDQWIIPGGFSSTVRLALICLLGLVSVGWLIWKVVVPYLGSVNALYAAREIERAHPEFQSSLMTWVDFRRSGREVPASILASLEKRTAQQISKSNVDSAIDRRVLMRSSYVLLGLVVALSLYTVFSPKRMSVTLWRALLPLSAVQAATRTEIRDVKPGNTEVLARDQLDVVVELAGHLPEEVNLLFSTADRRFVNEPLRMRRVDEQHNNFQARLSGDAGKGLLSDVTYHIEAGDARSKNYEVRVNQPPTANVTLIGYEYPQYMRMNPTTQQANSIDAWEGTWVTVTAKPNMPVKRAVLYCSDQESIQETAEAYPMLIRDDQLTARWQLKFRDDGTFARYFHVQVWNERGQKDPQPTIYRIKIRPDLKPEVQIVHPEQDMTVPANATIPVGLSARDPDFLLRKVSLKLQINNEDVPGTAPLFEAPPEKAEFQTVSRLELAKLNVKPGDRVALFVEAEDNFEPFGKRQKNIARSPRVTLTIVDPAPPEQKRQLEQQQNEQLQQKMQPAENDQRQREGQPQQQAGPREKPPQKGDQPKPAQPPRQGGEPMPPQDANPPEQGAGQKNQPGQGKEDQSQQNRSEKNQPGQRPDQSQPGQPGSEQMPQEGGSGEGENKTPQPGEMEKQPPQNGQKPGAEQQQGRGKGSNGQTQQQPGGQSSSDMKGGDGQQESGKSDPAGRGQNQSGKGAGNEPPRDKVDEDQALQKLLDWSNQQKEKEAGNKSANPQQGKTSPQGDQPKSTPDQKNTNSDDRTDGQQEKGEASKSDPAGSPGARPEPGMNSEGKTGNSGQDDKSNGNSPADSTPSKSDSSSPEMGKNPPPGESSKGDKQQPGQSASDSEAAKNGQSRPENGPNNSSQPTAPDRGNDPGMNGAEKKAGDQKQTGPDKNEISKNQTDKNRNGPGESQPGQTGSDKMPQQDGQSGQQPGKMDQPGQNQSGQDPRGPQPGQQQNRTSGKEQPGKNSQPSEKTGDQKQNGQPGMNQTGQDQQPDPTGSQKMPQGDQRGKDDPAAPKQGQGANDQTGKDQPGKDGQPGQPKQGEPGKDPTGQQSQNQPSQNPSGKSPKEQGPANGTPQDRPGADRMPQQQGEPGNSQQQPGKQSDQPGDASPGQSPMNQDSQGPGQQSGKGQPGQSPNQSPGQPSGPSQQSQNSPSGSEQMSPGQAPGQNGRPGEGKGQEGQAPQGGDNKNQPGKNSQGKDDPDGQPGKGGQGQPQKGDNPTGQGQPGNQQGQPGQNGQPTGNQKGDGQPGSGGESGQPSMPGGQDGTGQQRPGPNGKSNNQAATSDTHGGANENLLTPEAADLAHRKAATELALKRLKEQMERGQKPEELLRQMGYTEQDLDKFMNKLEQRLADPGTDRSAESDSARRQFDSILKGLRTDSAGQLRGGGNRERKATESFGSGNRLIPPEYRRDTEAYKEKLSK